MTEATVERWHQAPEVLEAAQRWRTRCLLTDGSVLSSHQLWTIENIDQLDRHFVQNLDWGAGDFLQKLEAQLAPTTAGAKQLAAEMLWLLFLFISASAMGAASKRASIKRVWEWSGEPLPTSPELGAVLERGVGHPGTAYQTHRWRELVFLIEAMGRWKRLATAEQQRIASDAWSFAEWLDWIKQSKGRQLRDILLYLLFPNHFERIASGNDKRNLVRHFREEFGESAEFSYDDRIALDREVLRIRERLSQQYQGTDLDFYHGALRQKWKPDGTVLPSPPKGPAEDLEAWYAKTFGTTRVWAIATGEGGRLWPEFQRDGIIAIGQDYVGDLSTFKSREEIREAILAGRRSQIDPLHDSLAAWEFSHDMQVGDHVIAKRGTTEILGHGTVSSPYEYDDERTEYPHLRRVTWTRTGRWTLSEDRRVVSKTLTDVSKYKSWLRPAWEQINAPEASPSGPGPAPVAPFTESDAMQGLFLPVSAFREMLDALGRKKNIILEGPPGVGKTFIARRLAYALMRYKDPQRVEVVQFHQSYSYEDFVEGWRPNSSGGFHLQKGVFHRFCDDARQDPDRPYVFIIDEINRGNLSKIFGELMTLIEGDKRGPDHAIQLTYSTNKDNRFSVPENVYVIGLMNTADRSLALVDYALRRRFSFVRLEPQFASEAFSDYLQELRVDPALVARIVDRFRELNEIIREDSANLGPGFEIGHSFFVPPAGAERLDDSWFESVIYSEIEPLLREYWFDKPERVANTVTRLTK